MKTTSAEIKRTVSEATYVSSGACHQYLTAAAVIEFAAAIRQSGIPLSTRITAHHANDTRHLVKLSAQHVTKREEPAHAAE